MADSNLFEMLADLAKHPQKLAQFQADPDGAMTLYGLNEGQKSLIKSALQGKNIDFYKAVGDEVHAQFGAGPDVAIC